MQFTVRYATLDGDKKEFVFPLNIYEPKNYICQVAERAKSIYENRKISVDAVAYIQYKMTNAYTYDESAHRVFYSWYDISRKLDMIEMGEYDHWLASEGIKSLYYLS